MLCFLFAIIPTLKVEAKSGNDKILEGVYIGNVDVSNMTYEEASLAMENYMTALDDVTFTFEVANSSLVTAKASELGLSWDNEEVLEEAVNLGKTGNVIERYKVKEDLKHGNYTFDMDLNFDATMILEVLEDKCQKYNVAAVDYSLVKTDDGFEVKEGTTGFALNIDESLDIIQSYLENEWNREDATLTLEVEVTTPRGSTEELSVVGDVLGTYTTSYSSSGKERSANVENGCRLINGITLYPGDEFSTLETITPFSEENGYQLAASYLNGLVVESLGGGICQVSTTLYNAVLLSELEVSARSNHSMIVAYVQPSMDAAIAESSGKDFKFVNNTDYPIYIEGITQNKKITFTIYGVETRSESHKVYYESEVLTTTEPEGEKIVTDSSKEVGYINITSAHTGYTAQLWKITTEDGVEVSREVINKSTYKMAPRTATVGISTTNSDYLARINEAVATGDINTVKAVANQISAEIAIAGATSE